MATLFNHPLFIEPAKVTPVALIGCESTGASNHGRSGSTGPDAVLATT